MKIVTIGGLPAAGKTYVSKLLATELNCVALEVESLRWNYFEENPQDNMFYYTNNEKFKEQESLREYYLRCTLYERKISFEELVEWHKKTIKYIDEKIPQIVEIVKNMRTKEDYAKFCDKYKDILNYVPKFDDFNREVLIISHAFINVMQFSKFSDLRIDLDSKYSILKKRFLKREKIIDDINQNLLNYYNSYSEVLRESDAIKVDTIEEGALKNLKYLIMK